MKKKKITYGVAGMMEYQAVVNVGRRNVSINFSDGSISAMGTNPATFITDNIILQNAIEASHDFKRGRITIVRTIVLEEELPIVRNVEKPAETPTTVATVATEKIDNETDEEETVVEECKENGADAPAPLTQVEFSCNDDAKDYLEQNYGYVRSKLHNRQDIINAGKACGVEIIFI